MKCPLLLALWIHARSRASLTPRAPDPAFVWTNISSSSRNTSEGFSPGWGCACACWAPGWRWRLQGMGCGSRWFSYWIYWGRRPATWSRSTGIPGTRGEARARPRRSWCVCVGDKCRQLLSMQRHVQSKVKGLFPQLTIIIPADNPAADAKKRAF